MEKRSPATIALIGLNVLIFAVLAWKQQNLLFNRPEDVVALLDAGANFNPKTLGNEPWRLISSMFLHFGILHLLVNMYGLWQLGQILESGVGSGRYTILYFICGLTAGFASVFFNVLVVSAGASGAIFGLYGFVLGAELISFYRDRENLKRVLLNFGIFVAINILITRGLPVDLAGHIGGFAAGIILAFCHFKLQVLRSHLAMIGTFAVLWLLFFVAPRAQKIYYDAFQHVLRLEDTTTQVLNTPMNDAALYDTLGHIKDEWSAIRSDLELITEVPGDLTRDLASLTEYVRLHELEASYRLHLVEETYIYADSIEALSPRFESVPRLERTPNFYRTAREDDRQDSTAAPAPSSLKWVKVLYDKDWKETTSEDAPYYRIGTRDSLGRWQGPVRDHYRNGDLQMKGVYKDDLKDGIFIYYSDHSTYSSAGRYVREEAVGKWQTFHWNGQLESEVFYVNPAQTRSVWDSLGRQRVAGGNGKYIAWFPNGAVREEGQYINGFKSGGWLGYRENGEPYFKEEWFENRLVRGMSLGKKGEQYIYDQTSFYPTPVIGRAKFNDYLERNVRVPENGGDGVVKLLFTVGADGSLWNFVVLQSSCIPCNAEAIRLVREGPAWRPTLIHGQEKVQSEGYAEVRFKSPI